MLNSSKRPIHSFLLLLTLSVMWFGAGCQRSDTGGEADAVSGSAAGHDSAAFGADGKPLGTVRLPTSCDAGVQADLERGLALLHHMTYDQAEAVFRYRLLAGLLHERRGAGREHGRKADRGLEGGQHRLGL